MGYQNDLGADALWEVMEGGRRADRGDGQGRGRLRGPDRTARMIEAGARLLGTGRTPVC
jgi:hypothetical protein